MYVPWVIKRKKSDFFHVADTEKKDRGKQKKNSV